MKKMVLSIMAWAVMLCQLNAQSFSDEKTFTFEVNNLNLLHLHNKFGNVQVKGTDGTKAVLKVKRTIKASSRNLVTAAKANTFLDSTYNNGELIFFVEMPDYHLEINENGQAYYTSDYNNWNHSVKVTRKAKVEMEIELSVPKSTPLYISTHHKNLSIEDIKADVWAQNHHGSIQLKAIHGNVLVNTHHGKIQIELTKVPDKDATFDTHHGNIEVTFPQNLSADFQLKTRHGSFYTDFDYQAVAMPAKLTQGKKGTKYKVEGGTNIRIGNGGPTLNMETYHGSIYLLK